MRIWTSLRSIWLGLTFLPNSFDRRKRLFFQSDSLVLRVTRGVSTLSDVTRFKLAALYDVMVMYLMLLAPSNSALASSRAVKLLSTLSVRHSLRMTPRPLCSSTPATPSIPSIGWRPYITSGTSAPQLPTSSSTATGRLPISSLRATPYFPRKEPPKGIHLECPCTP